MVHSNVHPEIGYGMHHRKTWQRCSTRAYYNSTVVREVVGDGSRKDWQSIRILSYLPDGYT
jgi:hypothetical protein